MRREIDPGTNGPGAYRFLVGAAYLECQEAVYDDVKYAKAVMHLRRIAGPAILDQQALWARLRDGDGTGPGFWADEKGRPLTQGQTVPKEAMGGMVEAIMIILHRAGVFWFKETEKENATPAFGDAVNRSRLGGGKV